MVVEICNTNHFIRNHFPSVLRPPLPARPANPPRALSTFYCNVSSQNEFSIDLILTGFYYLWPGCLTLAPYLLSKVA